MADAFSGSLGAEIPHRQEKWWGNSPPKKFNAETRSELLITASGPNFVWGTVIDGKG